MFADDTNLFFNSSFYEITNSALKDVKALLLTNKLTLNTDKSPKNSIRCDQNSM